MRQFDPASLRPRIREYSSASFAPQDQGSVQRGVLSPVHKAPISVPHVRASLSSQCTRLSVDSCPPSPTCSLQAFRLDSSPPRSRQLPNAGNSPLPSVPNLAATPSTKRPVRCTPFRGPVTTLPRLPRVRLLLPPPTPRGPPKLRFAPSPLALRLASPAACRSCSV